MKEYNDEYKFVKELKVGNIGSMFGCNIHHEHSYEINVTFIRIKEKIKVRDIYKAPNTLFFGDYVMINLVRKNNTINLNLEVKIYEENSIPQIARIIIHERKPFVIIFPFDHYVIQNNSWNPRYFLLEKKDNPEEFFQKAIKLSNNSSSIVSSLKELIKTLGVQLKTPPNI